MSNKLKWKKLRGWSVHWATAPGMLSAYIVALHFSERVFFFRGLALLLSSRYLFLPYFSVGEIRSAPFDRFQIIRTVPFDRFQILYIYNMNGSKAPRLSARLLPSRQHGWECGWQAVDRFHSHQHQSLHANSSLTLNSNQF